MGETHRKRMKIVVLTATNCAPHKDYDNPAPHFGAAPEANVDRLFKEYGYNLPYGN